MDHLEPIADRAKSHPRYTKDLDIWLDSTEANAEATLAALEEFCFGSVGLEIADFTKPDHVIQLGYEPNRIDLLTQLKGLQFEEAFSRKNTFNLSGIEVSFISAKDLMVNKRAVGRLHNDNKTTPPTKAAVQLNMKIRSLGVKQKPERFAQAF